MDDTGHAPHQPYAPPPQVTPYGYSAHYPPPLPPGKRSSTKWWLLGIGGAVGLMVMCCGGFIVLIFIGMQSPQGIAVQTDTPVHVAEGDSFTFTITVTNTNDTAQRIKSIDIDNAYLHGVAIQGSTPAYLDTFPIFGMTTYVFDHTIAPGQSMDIIFDATAARTGDHVGSFDVCINNHMNFVSHSIRTIVEPPESRDAKRAPATAGD